MTRFFLVLLTVSMITASIAAQEWFQSDISGTPGSPLSSGGPSVEGWSVQIERAAGRETQTFYKDGILQSSTVYHRIDGRLTARDELNAEGETISRIEYAWDAEGNPRGVIASANGERAAGYVEINARMTPDGTVLRHTEGFGDDWNVLDSNASGQTLRHLVVADGTLEQETLWKRDEQGKLEEEVIQTTDGNVYKYYDDDGRLIEERSYRNGVVVLLRDYTWEGLDLIRIKERGEGRLSIRELQWEEGRKVFESRSIDGITVSSTNWISAEEWVETLFRDGVAVIQVYWNRNEKVREEFLKDGEVVRIRNVKR